MPKQKRIKIKKGLLNGERTRIKCIYPMKKDLLLGFGCFVIEALNKAT